MPALRQLAGCSNREADSLPARQSLSPRPCGSFIASFVGNIPYCAQQSKNHLFRFDFSLLTLKSTFELPSEEWR